MVDVLQSLCLVLGAVGFLILVFMYRNLRLICKHHEERIRCLEHPEAYMRKIQNDAQARAHREAHRGKST